VTNKKNAFRFPKDPSAVFPQAEQPVFIDKRASYVKREYLEKEQGMKHKNRKKKALGEIITKSMKLAESGTEGLESDVINIGRLGALDEELNNFKMENFKISQVEDDNDDGDIEMNDGDKKSMTVGKKKKIQKREKRKVKSHYIVNFK
jgi:hypothetical protein